MTEDTEIEYTIEPRRVFSLGLAELWRYRELFYFFTWRDVKVKYKQTILGFLWAVLQPLAMMLVFVLFFSNMLNISTDDIPAPIFYFSGLLLWNLFSSGLAGAANSMVDNANIIKKVYFPRLVIPLSAILVALFDFLMALLIFMGLMGYYTLSSDTFLVSLWTPLYFLVGLLITLITSAGLGMLLAALNVKYRDFRYVIPFMVQFLMFVSPVIYPVSIAEGKPVLKWLLSFNPMSGALELARVGLRNAEVDYTLLGISITSSFIIFVVGLITFRRTEFYFADLA